MIIDQAHFKAVHDALLEHQKILMAAWGKVMMSQAGRRPGAKYVDGLRERTESNRAALEALKAQIGAEGQQHAEG